MSSPPLPDLDALSAHGLKRLVARLLARVVALDSEDVGQLGADGRGLDDGPALARVADRLEPLEQGDEPAPGQPGAIPAARLIISIRPAGAALCRPHDLRGSPLRLV